LDVVGPFQLPDGRRRGVAGVGEIGTFIVGAEQHRGAEPGGGGCGATGEPLRVVGM
jgi:hypothetical protein